MKQFREAPKPIKYLLLLEIAVLLVIAGVTLSTERPDKISGLTVEGNTFDSVNLSWEASEQAKGYLVYRASEDGEYKYVASTAENQYTDSGLRTGANYSYYVTARNGFKLSTSKGETVNAIPKMEKPELKLDSSKGQMELKISEVDGAIGYEIRRDGEVIGQTDTNHFIDSDAADDTSHKYTVRAVRYKKNPVYSEESDGKEGELHSVKDFNINTEDGDLLLEWGENEHYKKYKIYNGKTLLTETEEYRYTIDDYKLSEIYEIKIVGVSENEDSISPESVKKFKVVEEDMNTEGALDEVCKWAVNIAEDNDFHYGNGQAAHHEGCYYCGTQPSVKKSIPKYEKTYCCNPFVTAAFAHGCADPTMLKACKRADSYIEKDFKASSLFKNLGKPSRSELKKGDVLCCRNGHVMIYLGDGQLVEAANGDNGKINSSSWNKSITVGPLNNNRYNNSSYGVTCAFRYTGKGNGKMAVIKYVDEQGNIIEDNNKTENSDEA